MALNKKDINKCACLLDEMSKSYCDDNYHNKILLELQLLVIELHYEILCLPAFIHPNL